MDKHEFPEELTAEMLAVFRMSDRGGTSPRAGMTGDMPDSSLRGGSEKYAGSLDGAVAESKKHETGFNGKSRMLELKRGVLKEKCAERIETYTHMVNVAGPNIKSRYMVLIGRFEHRVFELMTEIRRWQRRFALKQMALNRGNRPDLPGIEAKLDEEFAGYIDAVERNIAEIREAEAFANAEKMSAEESARLRAGYLDAVKKLHPDINRDLPESAKELWNRIQWAHSNKDWECVGFLCSIVDGVVGGKATVKPAANAIEALEEEVHRLEKTYDGLNGRIRALMGRRPFVYKDMLADPDAVAERQALLFAKIAALEKNIGKYRELWENGR